MNTQAATIIMLTLSVSYRDHLYLLYALTVAVNPDPHRSWTHVCIWLVDLVPYFFDQGGSFQSVRKGCTKLCQSLRRQVLIDIPDPGFQLSFAYTDRDLLIGYIFQLLPCQYFTSVYSPPSYPAWFLSLHWLLSTLSSTSST